MIDHNRRFEQVNTVLCAKIYWRCNKMDIESNIRKSKWWATASQTHDRHYPEHINVSMADHCESVFQSLKLLLDENPEEEYPFELALALETFGISQEWICEILKPVALLHDLGKPLEDKKKEIPHPITGKMKAKKHPILGIQAALEILPRDYKNRDTIIALIEEHATPFSWYCQFQATNQIPGLKAWRKMDRKIVGEEDGKGIVLLSVFKIVDTDGHENIQDVIWFIEKANEYYLKDFGIIIPIPSENDIRKIDNALAFD